MTSNEQPSAVVINADCLQHLSTMADNSIDAIVTDPPYELGFMGKTWDSTGIAYNTEVWAQCLRVLKPGGHLLAFGGSRTYHRLAVAIEDAGFQIRDQIMWVYGSGFPKSLDVSKAIDKMAGAEREVLSSYETHDIRNAGLMDKKGALTVTVTAPATDAAKQWEGWGTALKPAHEPIVLARKSLDGTVANNVLTHGVGGLNIDGCKVGDELIVNHGGGVNSEGRIYGSGVGIPATEANSNPRIGRFPANFIHDGSDEVVELFPETKSGARKVTKINGNKGLFGLGSGIRADADADSGSAARFFYCAKANKRDRNEGLDHLPEVRSGGMQATLDGTMLTGSGNERTTTNRNHHPTVKPTDLMRYLCRLITPPNGTVLDPFTGSGSTGKAAVLEGFNFVGIEQSAEYVEIATARIKHAKDNL